MRAQNGSDATCNQHSVKTPLQTFVPVTQSQADFLELVRSHGYQDFSRSLKLVHDIALYHSDVNFEDTEKTALFDLKVLWEGLDQLQHAG